jgi:hypothetical protein
VGVADTGSTSGPPSSAALAPTVWPDLSRDLNDTNPDVHPHGQSATCRGTPRPSGRLVYVGSPLPSVIHTNWSSSSGIWAVQIGMTVYTLPGWDWGAGR